MSRFAPPHCCTDSSAAPLPRKTRRFWYAVPKNPNCILSYWIYQRHVLQFSLMRQEGKALGKSKWRKIFLIKPVVPHLMLLFPRWCCKSRTSHFALLPYWFSQAITTSDYMLCLLSFKICFFFYPLKPRSFCVTLVVVVMSFFCILSLACSCMCVPVHQQPYTTSCESQLKKINILVLSRRTKSYFI